MTDRPRTPPPAAAETRDRLATLLLIALVTAWSAVFAFTAIANHELFRTNCFDLGLFDQSLWLISHGHYPFSTGMGVHVLGDHASLIVYPLALLYAVLPDVRALLALQCLAVAAVAIPVFLAAKDRGRPWLGLIVAAATLAHPGLQNLALFDFHPDSLAAAFLAFALLALARKRDALACALAGLVMLTKESFALTALALGVWLLAQKRWKAGIALSAGSLLWFFFALYVLLPAMNGSGSAQLVRFAAFGGTLPEIVLSALREPGALVRAALSPDKVHYAGRLVFAFGPLPLLGFRWIPLALPALGLNLVSDFPPQWSGLYHYDALAVPVLAFAAVHGLLFVADRFPRTPLPIVVTVSFLGAFAYRVQQSWPLRRVEYAQARRSPPAHVGLYDELIARIPPRASVSAQTHLQPHVSHRREAYLFPNPFKPFEFRNPSDAPFPLQADYVLYDTKIEDDSYLPRTEKVALLRGLVTSGAYEALAEEDGVLLLKRLDHAGAGPPAKR